MNTDPTRRLALATLGVTLGTLGIPRLSMSQQVSTWPQHPVRIVVPAAAGTAPDSMIRMYAEHLSRIFGQQFVVDNKAGASGNIGTDAVAHSPGDGYTLLYAFNQIFTMNPHLFEKMSYDPVKDLTPISITIQNGYVLLANNNFPASNLKEALAFAKANPGKVTYASYGPGTAAHLAFEIIQDQTQTRFLHIPYKQGWVQDVMAGHVDMVFDPLPSGIPYATSGKVKALAVTTPNRLAALPDTPTMSEAVQGFDMVGWQGVWAPAGTPADILTRLQEAFARITQMPDMQKRIRELGSEPVGSSSQQMAQTIQTESAKWGKVIKSKNIRLD